jgi:hypothetical protein
MFDDDQDAIESALKDLTLDEITALACETLPHVHGGLQQRINYSLRVLLAMRNLDREQVALTGQRFSAWCEGFSLTVRQVLEAWDGRAQREGD